jgi:hypothetical protein
MHFIYPPLPNTFSPSVGQEVPSVGSFIVGVGEGVAVGVGEGLSVGVGDGVAVGVHPGGGEF